MVTAVVFEPGIHLFRWVGDIDMKDARAAYEALKPGFDGQPFVDIIDMKEVKSLPKDLTAMRAIIKDQMRHGLKAYVIYAAPPLAQMIGKHISVLAPTRYLWERDWDTTVQTARQLLAEARAK